MPIDPALQVVVRESLARGEELLVRDEALQNSGDGHTVNSHHHLARVICDYRSHDSRPGERVEV